MKLNQLAAPKLISAISIAACISLACGPAATPVEAPRPAPTTAAPAPADGLPLAQDTPLKFPSGAATVVPKGWYLTQRQGIAWVRDPERELSLAVLEVQAPSAQDAVLEAFIQLAKTEFQLFPERGSALPEVATTTNVGSNASDWDEMVQYTYKVAPGMHALSNARRSGNFNLVALSAGKLDAVTRRSAQINAMVLGLKPSWVSGEDLSARRAEWSDEHARAFAEFAERARAQLGIPGAQFAVLGDSAIVSEGALGQKKLGNSAPVGAHTKFLLGSVTKSFTSAAIAALATEGRIKWEDRLQSAYPKFRLGAPATTEQASFAQMLCACGGLPRRDLELVFEYAGVSPENALAQLADLQPTTPFGAVFQQSNHLASAGGYIAGLQYAPTLAPGPAYARLVEDKLLKKLDLRDSTLKYEAAQRGDAASSHQLNYEGEVVALAPNLEQFVVPIAPAAGMWSTAHDLALFAALELRAGALPNGTRVASEAEYLARRKPYAEVTAGLSYGLGVMIGHSHGLDFVQNSGVTFGMSAFYMVIPGKGAGLAVVSNAAHGTTFASALELKYLELAFRAKPHAEKLITRTLREREKQAAARTGNFAQPPPAVQSKWLGSYESAQLGRVQIARSGERLFLDAGEWQSRIAMASDGSEELVLLDPPVCGLRIGFAAPDTLELNAGQLSYKWQRLQPSSTRKPAPATPALPQLHL